MQHLCLEDSQIRLLQAGRHQLLQSAPKTSSLRDVLALDGGGKLCYIYGTKSGLTDVPERNPFHTAYFDPRSHTIIRVSCHDPTPHARPISLDDRVTKQSTGYEKPYIDDQKKAGNASYLVQLNKFRGVNYLLWGRSGAVLQPRDARAVSVHPMCLFS